MIIGCKVVIKSIVAWNLLIRDEVYCNFIAEVIRKGGNSICLLCVSVRLLKVKLFLGLILTGIMCIGPMEDAIL